MSDLLIFIPYFLKYKRSIVMGIVCILVSVAISLRIPLVVGRAVDDLRLGVTTNKLKYYGLIILGLSVVSGLFLFLQRRIFFGISRHVEYDLRTDFYTHLQRMPPSFFQANQVGDLMAHATNDLAAVHQLAGPMVLYTLQTSFFIALILPLMMRISTSLTLILFLSMPVVLLVVRYFGRKIHIRFGQVQELFSQISARAHQNFTGVRVVRAFAREKVEMTAFTHLNHLYVERNMSLARIFAVMRPLVQFLIGAGFWVIVWYGGTLVIRGEITLGQFTEFTLYLGRLIWPLVALGFVIGIYQRGTASLKRINAIFAIKPAIENQPGACQQPPISGCMELRNLTFGYHQDREPVLRSINLRIGQGQTVALVGRTGSGKSTLMNLFLRLLEAPPDTVFIDGVSVRDYPLAQLRGSIGYVPQETFLFSETLAKNIAFGVDEAERPEIERAADVAGLSDDLRGFPEGIDTMVGERGITLSGGQKQRTAIARAVLRQPRILLLDDALSSVDTDTEKKVLAQIRTVMRDRTSLIVSHRVSTVRDADQICVLAEGEIIERGTHDELLVLGGEYADLYQRQLLEEELAAS